MSKIPYDLTRIKGVVFDIDGVLSPCMVPLGADGNPQRMANIKDGYALQLAVRKGLKLAVISGATGEGLRERFANLGISDVYLRAGMKNSFLRNGCAATGSSRKRWPMPVTIFPTVIAWKSLGCLWLPPMPRPKFCRLPRMFPLVKADMASAATLLKKS